MEENVPHIKSEFHENQEDEVDGWIPSTRSEVKVPSTRSEEDIPSTRSEFEMEEQLSVSSIEEDGFFSVKIEVPDASLITDTDDEEKAERHELHEGDETEDETNYSGEAGTSEGMSEHLSKTAFSQEFVEVERVMPNVGNDRQPSPSNSGIESIINSSVQGVFTQEKQCHLSTKELSQINEGKHSKQERKDSVTEAEIQPRQEGNCPGNEFSILKNILEGNNSSRNVINCTKCLLCDQVFASKGDLDIHVKIHIGVRGNTGGNSEKNLESKDSLMQQKSIKTTEKRFKCDSCEKSYSSVKSLKRHRIAHSGVKQFKCQYCDKEFLSSHHVLRHERVHTGEKPFGCRYCPKKFSQKASLMGHEMVHTGEKPFICRFCEKRFVQKISLTRHERIHTGEKPFHCKYCDKRFVQESNLICHERVHTNEKPYGCSRCDKKFARKCDLIRHEEIHAREVPFRMFATSILQNLIKTHSSA